MDIWLEFLYSALRSPYGIAISVDDHIKAKQRLYRAQKSDPSLVELSFRTSPDDPKGEIWIVKNA